jgi:predicted nucleic acid-binding protein
VALLLDANLWIGLIRVKSPLRLKELIAPSVADPRACLAEPIVFEVLRGATDVEARRLAEYFETLPILANPAALWSDGVELGRQCMQKGISPGSIDLLISVIALHHAAELVTFDEGFSQIAKVSDLQIKLLKYPVP